MSPFRTLAAEELVLSLPFDMEYKHSIPVHLTYQSVLCVTLLITVPDSELQHRLFQIRQGGKTQQDKANMKMHCPRKLQIVNLQALLSPV